MDNSFIEKYKLDPKWREVLILYSGLFKTDSDRYSFINEIIDKNNFLAAQCITTSLSKNEDLENKIKLSCNSRLNFSTSWNKNQESLDSFLALVEFEEYEPLLNLFSYSHGRQIVELISIIPSILGHYKNNLEHALSKILNTFPEYYIKTIIDSFDSEKDLNICMIDNILNLIISNNQIKAKHLINLIKLRKNGSVLNINEDIFKRLLIEANSFEDIKFLVSNFDPTLKFGKIIEFRTKKKLTFNEGYIILQLLLCDKEFKNKKLNNLIEKLIQSFDLIQLTLAIIFIYYFDKTNDYKHEIKSAYFVGVFRLKKRLLFDKKYFITSCNQIYKIVKEDKYLENINNFIGNILILKVVAIWKYHYVLQSNSKIIRPSLLPFEECNQLLKKGDELKVIVIHADAVNMRLITSMKQINNKKSELYFKNDYLNLVKRGDIITCKVDKVNDFIRLSPKGIGKHVKCKVKNNINNLILDKTEYQAEVIGIISPFKIYINLLDV